MASALYNLRNSKSESGCTKKIGKQQPLHTAICAKSESCSTKNINKNKIVTTWAHCHMCTGGFISAKQTGHSSSFLDGDMTLMMTMLIKMTLGIVGMTLGIVMLKT